MRNLFTIVFTLIITNLFAEGYIPSKIIYKDGSSIDGYAKQPKARDNSVMFRNTEKGEKTSIPNSKIKTIVMYYKEDTLEFDQIKTLRYYSKNKVIGPFWMLVLERGYATLYTYYEGGGSYTSNTGYHYIPGDRFFPCIKKEESHATIISHAIHTGINNNTYFKKFASKYFSDYPELSNMIKTKKYKYEDIVEVVEEYNKWKSMQ